MKNTRPPKNSTSTHIPLAVGLILLVLVAVFAFYIPIPTGWQQNVFLTVLALSAAGIAAIIPGFIEVEYKGFLRAGGALAVFCIVYFFKPQTSASDQSFSLTVFVHGTKGKQDIVLENTGQLNIDFEDDRRRAQIEKNGRTVFAGIPGKIRNRQTTIGLEAAGFELAEPSKEYTLDGTPIYLALKKKEEQQAAPGATGPTKMGVTSKPATAKNCTVSGLIKEKSTDKAIGKAKITLMCDGAFHAESDQGGYFSLSVPGNLKGDRCLIRVESAGKSKEIYAPVCDPNLIEIKIE